MPAGLASHGKSGQSSVLFSFRLVLPVLLPPSHLRFPLELAATGFISWLAMSGRARAHSAASSSRSHSGNPSPSVMSEDEGNHDRAIINGGDSPRLRPPPTPAASGSGLPALPAFGEGGGPSREIDPPVPASSSALPKGGAFMPRSVFDQHAADQKKAFDHVLDRVEQVEQAGAESTRLLFDGLVQLQQQVQRLSDKLDQAESRVSSSELRQAHHPISTATPNPASQNGAQSQRSLKPLDLRAGMASKLSEKVSKEELSRIEAIATPSASNVRLKECTDWMAKAIKHLDKDEHHRGPRGLYLDTLVAPSTAEVHSSHKEELKTTVAEYDTVVRSITLLEIVQRRSKAGASLSADELDLVLSGLSDGLFAVLAHQRARFNQLRDEKEAGGNAALRTKLNAIAEQRSEGKLSDKELEERKTRLALAEKEMELLNQQKLVDKQTQQTDALLKLVNQFADSSRRNNYNKGSNNTNNNNSQGKPQSAQSGKKGAAADKKSGDAGNG